MFTRGNEEEDGMDGAPNSVNTSQSCWVALIPPKDPGEYETIADGLK